MAEPLKVAAGDTWTWTRDGGDYPASAGWVLTYYFSLPGGTVKDQAATASGPDFTVTIAATTTKDWAPGLYGWTARVAKGSEAYTVGTGRMRVQPDPSTAASTFSHAEKCLAQIEAALETCFGDSIVEFELDGFKVKKNRSELVSLRNSYRQEVRSERGQLGVRVIPVSLR